MAGEIRNARHHIDTRRDSILLAQNELHELIAENLSRLRAIWDLVGMNDEQRHERIDTAVLHVKRLLEEMVNEEQEMHESLREGISACSVEIIALCRELKCDTIDPDERLCLLKAEEFLRNQLDRLRDEKRHRLQVFSDLQDEDAELSEKLCEPRLVNCDDSTQVPSQQEVSSLRERVEEKRLRVTRNRDVVSQLKVEAYRFMRKLACIPRTALERTVCSDSVDDLPLSDQFLLELKFFRDELEVQCRAHLALQKRRLDEAKAELEVWWNKCHSGMDERAIFPQASEENFDDIELNRYKMEISRLKAYYVERQEILAKVELWKQLWDQKISFEAKDKDFNRFLNRGGALLQEEKERRNIEKRLPLINQEISQLIIRWDVDHPGNPFCIDGVSVSQQLDKIQSDHSNAKEAEKAAKQIAKKQQLVAERLYGTSPVTPTKKRPISALSRGTPSNVGARDASTTRNYIHSSLAATRSPSSSHLPTTAAAERENNAVSGRGLPPRARQGLPPMAGGVALKRRALGNQPGERLAPLPRTVVISHDVPLIHDASVVSSTTSGATYHQFAQECKEKGPEAQSSFIAHSHQGSSPENQRKF